MKNLILLSVSFILSASFIYQAVSTLECDEHNCTLFDGKYICKNKNLTYIPVFAESAEFIDLSGNLYPRLESKEFKGFTHLKVLILSNVSLKEIHRDTFRDLKFLEVLDLSKNLLKTLYPDLFNHNMLHSLNLAGNSFKRLAANQFETPYLRRLDLSGCVLENISDTSFANVRFLKWLDLSDNNLKSVQMVPLFASFARIEVLIMDGNPWICDCEFYIMKTIRLITDHSRSLKCYYEREDKYKYVNETDFLDKPCEDYRERMSVELVSNKVEKNSKDEAVPDMILSIYGYVIFGILVLILLCCCCESQNMNAELAAPSIRRPHFTTPATDNYYVEEPISGKPHFAKPVYYVEEDKVLKGEQIYTFDKSSLVEVHREE